MAPTRELVGVADAGGRVLHQHVRAGARALRVDGLDGQRGARPVSHGSTNFHHQCKGGSDSAGWK